MFFQFPESGQNLGNPSDFSFSAHRLRMWSCGITRHGLPVFNRAYDAGLSPDRHVVAHAYVADNADLAGDGHPVADFCAAGDTRLSRNETILPDAHIVGDLH